MNTVNSTRRTPSVVIAGAGMTGILLTIKLQEAGIGDITVLEKADRIGGTWRENTYPGVACDVPAHMYTYSFEPNPDWSSRFAAGDEIQAYFQRVADKYGVTAKTRFGEAVTDARYQRGKWRITTSKGQNLVADFFINATGILHHPVKPNIDGIRTFKGAMFHSAEWDHSVDLTGKTVGIIGTGSTGTQLIAELANTDLSLKVFQRTPQWVGPAPNRRYSAKLKQKCRRNPLRIPLARSFYKVLFEQIFSKAVIGQRIPHAVMSFLCKFKLRTQVTDPELRARLTPEYTVGCKRLVLSSTFYKAIQLPNVALITEGIERINEHGVLTVDGKRHELDVIVLATGFDPFAFMRPMGLHGKDGVDIEDSWNKKIQAYRSICLPDFPNFFLMLGPNSPIGNYSVIRMSEVQTDFLLKLIERWRGREFDQISATPDALKRFNAYLKAGMGKTVWISGGCQSWYLDADGDPVSWPYTWKQWVREMAEPDMADFAMVSFTDRTTPTEDDAESLVA